MLTKEQKEQITDGVCYSGDLVLNAEGEWVELSEDVEPLIEEAEDFDGTYYYVQILKKDKDFDEEGIIYNKLYYDFRADDVGCMQLIMRNLYSDEFYRLTDDGFIERIDD